MANETTVYIKRILDNKYEFISRNLDMESGSYTIQNIDGLWIMKKTNSTGPFKEDVQSKGFFIFEDINQATEFAKRNKEKIENEEIIGIKGFNNKFYFFASTYYNEKKKIFLDSLTQKGNDLDHLVSKIGINEEIVRGLIELLKEEGLIFERTRGTFFKV
jgi:hypothetical protein